MASTESQLLTIDWQKFSALRILVVGDVMIDSWVQGQVKRISPEAPVPVINVESTQHMLGGAANVARNVASLGATVCLFGVLGKDSWADVYHNEIRKYPNIINNSVQDLDRPTTVKTRIVGNHQQIARLDQESTQQISPQVSQQIVQLVRNMITSYDCVIVSDYAKGVITSELMNGLQVAAGLNDVPVLVDPKCPDWKLYQGSTLITPNLHEFKDTVNLNQLLDGDLTQQAQQLISKYDLGAVLVTQADAGMTLVQSGHHVHVPADKREVSDVSGAGDTVIAMMACAIAAGLPLQMATLLSNKAAGISVSKAGTATVSVQEMQQAIRH